MLGIVANPGSKYTATSGTPANLSGMATNRYYALTCTADILFKQGSAPTASAADGSSILHAGDTLILDGGNGAVVSVVQVAAAGAATLTPVTIVR
ncbi:MAG TPA: hypothetical protein VIY48_10080 [Candidatus Paceibacterota bacterium]